MGNDTPDRHITNDELGRRFQLHPADAANQQEALNIVRTACLEAAAKIVEATGPSSREQSTAVTKIEEAFLWAKTAIERSDGPTL
jgi:hypothetical protein